MKKLFVILAIVLIMVVSASAASRLEWDASTGNVKGYIVYYTLIASQNALEADWHTEKVLEGLTVPNIKKTLNLNVGSEYIFYVKAYNDAGQSGKSNTVTYVVPAFEPPDDSTPDQILVIPGNVTLKAIINAIRDILDE